MTWKDLCEKAKELGAEVHKDYIVFHEWLYFRKDKYILTENDWGMIEQEIVEYDQMLAIMEVLIDKDISVPNKGEKEKLQKKLEIATKALKETRKRLLHVELSGLDGDNRQKMYDLMFEDGVIDKALKEMEEV